MVNAVSTSDTTAAATAMKKSTGMNKDDFLKLFVTQLQHQDPLKPQDSNEFIAQLAQLTQVEQAYNANSNLANLLNAMQGSTNMSAISFIGKEVLANGNQISLTAGGKPDLSFKLDTAAESIALEIRDAAGIPVRTITGAKTPAGEQTLNWDGLGNGGKTLPAGRYTFAVTAVNAEGAKFEGTPLMKGKVSGVNLEGKTPVLSVGGLDVPMTDILSVKGVI